MTNRLCRICGKEIPEKRIAQGKDTCSRACLMKEIMSSKEYKDKMSNSVKRAFENPEHRQALSEAQRKRFADKEKLQNFKDAINRPEVKEKVINRLKQSMKNPEVIQRISKAQKRRFADPDKKKAFIEAMNRPEVRANKSKAQQRPEVRRKINEAQKKNKTVNDSKSAIRCKQYLRDLGYIIEEEKEYINAPNLHCDVYIVELDLWIELAFSQFHQFCVYDSSNEEHQKQLKELQNRHEAMMTTGRHKTQYSYMIYTWTDLDVRKRQCAKDNNMNFLEFFFEKDFMKWAKDNLKPKSSLDF